MVCGILLLHIAVRRLEVLEIDVDIRHADTVRVQEALEQQGVLDRVQIGDFQAICHHGARSGTSSRPHQRTCRPGCRNIILDYEEVVRETHTAYGLELEVYPFCLLRIQSLSVAHPGTLIGEMAKIGHGTAEVLPAVISLVVATSFVNDALIFVEIKVYVGEEIRIQVELREHVAPVYGITLYLRSHF